MGKKETEKAIADSRAGRVSRVGSVDELLADLNAGDDSATRPTMAELLADHRRQALPGVDGQLEHLDDAGLVVHHQALAGFGLLAEAADFPGAPFGLEIARGEDGDEERGAGELLEDFVGEAVVAAQLVVAPDVGGRAEALAEQGLQGAVEQAHPARLVGREGLVVQVGVADEDLPVEFHRGGAAKTGSVMPAGR